MRIYTTANLSENISKTPEGYLLCQGAALARTGVMAYLPDEVPPEIVTGFDGDQVLIARDAAEVFAPATLASFEGKPFTLDHPSEDVNPDNWSELAHGIVTNVRRGDGRRQDLMLADILITEADAIDAVLHDGMRELAGGYDCDFEVIRPGVGRQINIMGNHVALVDHGRAGARCKIQDNRETAMKDKKKSSLADRLRRMLKDAETEEAKAPQDEETPPAQDEETPAPVATDDDVAASLEEIKLMLRTLLEALKPQAQDEGPDQNAQDEDDPQQDEDPDQGAQNDDDPRQDEEPPAKSADRRPGRVADAATVRSAQRMGLTGARVGDGADTVRRSALALACRDADAARVVGSVLGGKPLGRASGAEVRAAFAAVAALTAAANNRRATDSLTAPADRKGRPYTPADINKLNAAYYGGKGGK